MRRTDGAEQPALTRGSAGGASPGMLERPALRLGQAAPLAIVEAEPFQSGVRITGEPSIGDLVDPLSGTALRQRTIGSSRYEHERHSGQRKEEFPHKPRTFALSNAISCV